MAEVDTEVPTADLEKMSLEPKPKEADEVGHEVEAEHHGEMMGMLKQVKIGTDVEFISIPAFVLRPESSLETASSGFDRADAFATIPDSDDPLERMLALIRFLVGGISLSVGKSTKKPYNPILGEILELTWDLGKLGGRQRYKAEQVSHHPPRTATFACNKKKGIFLNANQEGKGKFYGTSVLIRQVGIGELFLTRHGQERYTFNYPDLKISGFLWGRMTLEWVGDVELVCQETNLKAVVEYKPKPWFRGKYHVVQGKITTLDDTKCKKPVATLDGRWIDQISVTYTKTGQSRVLFDASEKPISRVDKPLEELDEFDSRRVWAKVTENILKKDFKQANIHKSHVEEEQRKRIRAMEGGEASYAGKLFVKNPHAEKDFQWRYKDLDNMLAKSRKKFGHK